MSDVKVLIIDDQEENVEYLTTILEDNGFAQVEKAMDGVEGLQKARSLAPGLVVLDVRMPKKSGVVVFNELKRDAATAGIPIIILTGEADFLKQLAQLRAQEEGREIDVDQVSDEVLAQFLTSKPQAFVEKPVEPEAFINLVNQVLGR